jgi:hypothetical protein
MKIIKEQFTKTKQEIIAQFEKTREAEMKKIKRERLLFEQQKKMNEILPDKRERHEISNLKDQIRMLTETNKAKLLKQQFETDRYKQKVTLLSKEKDQLVSQIQFLEQEKQELLNRDNERRVIRKVAKKKEAFTQTIDFDNENISDTFDDRNSYRKNMVVDQKSINQKRIDLKGIEKSVEKGVQNGVLHLYNNNQNHTEHNQDQTQTNIINSTSNFDELYPVLVMDDLEKPHTETELTDGKKVRIFEDGTKWTFYKNGTLKQELSNQTVIYFTNGDAKQVMSDADSNLDVWKWRFSLLLCDYKDDPHT